MDQNPLNFIDTFGYRVFSDELGKIPLSGHGAKTLNTISPNSYGLATKDPVFRDALQETDYLVLDGVYFALGSILQQGKNIRRNQGPDVFRFYMERMNDARGKVFFMGSSDKTLKLMQDRASEQYPNLQTFAYSPPFKDSFSLEENEQIINAINAVRPDIVFVGMTCPKQEKWSVANRDRLNTSLIVSIGNVFDWYAGTQKSIHPFWFKIRLGWLVRIFLRPEIFKRNIGNQMIYFGDVVKAVVTGRMPNYESLYQNSRKTINT